MCKVTRGRSGNRILCLARRALLVVALSASGAHATPSHGIAMHGDPALPPDFVSLPYANPDAPKGGSYIAGEPGSFDSLNPWIVKGRAPYGIGAHTVETLMGRSLDEPFSLYGLLAESIETDDARSWVEFTLRPEARFSDGSPVTVEDVIWSFQTLGTLGHPRYTGAWSKVAGIEATGPRKIRITFKAPDRELALLMGLRPVLKKADWQDRAFDETTLTPPIGSGPYVVDRVDPGRSITFRRNPDYWGKDLPFNRGLHNFDTLRYEYFGDPTVIFEAFKAGDLNIWRETNAAKWGRNYDFPALASGEVVKSEIGNARPGGMTGFVMNLRRPQFQDWRVRQALIEAFNFSFINQTMNDGAEPRIDSYFVHSALSGGNGPAAPGVAALLEPYRAELPPGTLEGWAPPPGNGQTSDRKALRRAVALLEEAGWSVQDGELRNAAGQPFRLEFLLARGASDTATIVELYSVPLRQLGIIPAVTSVDSAEYLQRTNAFDFDMAWMVRPMSLSPGNEMLLYFGSEAADQPGSRNLAGIRSAAVDGLIGQMLSAGNTGDFTAATRALDRVLTAGRYVVPVWYEKTSRVAHSRHLHYPARVPLYGFWPGSVPETWWYED